MPLAGSAQFSIVKITDYLGVLNDVSIYTKSAALPLAHMATDLTSFATAGGQSTSNQVKGARQVTPSVVMYYDPAILYILNQILACRAGTLWQFFQGTNAIPVPGDQAYVGTFTLFSYDLAYHDTQESTLKINIKPSEQGAVLPGWAYV